MLSPKPLSWLSRGKALSATFSKESLFEHKPMVAVLTETERNRLNKSLSLSPILSTEEQSSLKEKILCYHIKPWKLVHTLCLGDVCPRGHSRELAPPKVGALT